MLIFSLIVLHEPKAKITLVSIGQNIYIYIMNFNKDITRARLMKRVFPMLTLKKREYFEQIRSTALYHKEWKRISEKVRNTAEAELHEILIQ